MNQVHDLIKRLEEENKALKKQVSQFEADQSQIEYLKEILRYRKEVLAVITHDEKGSVENISESISAYGYSPDEFVSGKVSFWDIVYPEDLKILLENIEKKTKDGKGFELEYRILTKTGKVVWVMVTSIPITNSSGKIERYVVKINNVNKRKKYEEDLLDANENLFMTLKSIGESVILIDANGYINQLNAAAEKLIGIISLKAKNKPLNEVIRFSFSSDFSTFIDPLTMETETRKMVQLDEVFMQCPFGEQYRVSCNVSSIIVRKNKLAGYVMVVKDLTSIYNMLQTVRESEYALKAKLEILLSENMVVSDVRLTDIISIEQLQSLQDKFSSANGVSSVITDLNGVPITKPSNINDVCTSVFYSGEQCYQVNKLIHGINQIERPCKLNDAKAPIYIGEKHVADWKIGMCGYGGVIAPFVKAACENNEIYTQTYSKSLEEVKKHFRSVCDLLKVMANEISNIGYNNLKLAHELLKGKENEARLTESETTMRSIFDNSVDGIVLMDSSGVVKEWSRGYEQLSGVSKKQAIGKNIWEVVMMILPKNRYNSEETEQMRAELETIIHCKEQTLVTRHIINQKTKKERITHTLYFPVCLPGTTMIGAISRDATEDIINEQRLIENNALLEGIMNTIPAPVFVKDLNGDYTRFNDAFLKAFHLTKEQVLGKDVSSVLPEYSENIKREEAKLLTGNKAEHIETEVKIGTDKRDGVVYRNVFYDEVGKMQGIVGVIFDTTDMKNAERELIVERDRIQTLGDNCPNGCLYRAAMNLRTQEIRILYVSQFWEELSGGITAEDLVKDINLAFKRVHPEDLPKYLEAIKQSAITMQNLDVEVRFWFDNDMLKWVHVSAHPHLEDGYMVIWDGFILDITERKLSDLKLEAYRIDLENIVKERTEELEASNEELYATNEELYATNEEFAVTNEELHQKNDQLQHEIAARKEVMLQLEESESKMRNFVAQSFEGIVILDGEGKVIEWNAAQEKITEISHEEAIGKYSWELYQKLMPEQTAKKAGEEFRQQVFSLLKGGAHQDPLESEHMFYTGGNNERYINMTSFPIGLADKCYLGEIVHDITERKLIDIELERYRTQLEEMVASQTKELVVSKERLTSLSDNLPGGVIYQMIDKKNQRLQFTYISARFTDLFQTSIDEVMGDSSLFFDLIHPDDKEKVDQLYATADETGFIDMEYRICPNTDEIKWIHLRSSNHISEDGTRIWDGFMVDITEKKIAAQELEESRKRQNILIKVLQIVQSSENIAEAIDIALSEIGKYAGVSRSYIFEKSVDGKTVDNTYEWCNEGISPEIDNLQNVPIEYMDDWFVAFRKGEYICASDIATLSPTAYEQLATQGIKSILVLPLVANGTNYGFVGFDECLQYKEWQQKEVELLISLSQIISTTTRRLWAEKAMILSQQTMRTVLDNINASIYVADFDSYEVLFANKMVKDQMGEEIEGKKCWQVIQKDKKAPCDFCPNPKLLDKNKKPTGLYHWEALNENLQRWYECTDAAIEWVDGRLVHMEYATDITTRKKAEEAQRQSEELYRQLTIASPDAIVVCNPKGKIVFLSSKAKTLFLIDDETDINTLQISHFVHPHDTRKAIEMFRSFVQDNVAFLPQLLLMRNDGSDFFGEISSASVKNDKGQTTSVIMVIRDITERKMSEMELIRAKERAEESDNLKSAFLANMSHEIRTPINGIIGFLNFLADDNLTPKRRQEYITVVNNSSVQLVKLIDDIIDVAKIEAKQMSIRPVPFHLNEFMRELQVFFETYLQANNKEKIALILDDSGFIDPCITYVDPMRLRQILTNLIGNAIKFTEKGYIRFGYSLSTPDKLEFVVEDSGIGLAHDQQEVIFERFRQAELTNSRRYGGTGLGLTISRSLAQMMGGDISVESVEGEGSIFHFTISYLPISGEDEPLLLDESDAEKELGSKPVEGMSILLVEQEIMKSRYYEKLLSAKGATLITAQTTKQWIDTISQRKQIDVVLADAGVFSHCDDEIIKQVKSVRAGLPLILIIPERNEYYNRLILDSQCNKVIEGHIDFAKLYDILKKYLKE